MCTMSYVHMYKQAHHLSHYIASALHVMCVHVLYIDNRQSDGATVVQHTLHTNSHT